MPGITPPGGSSRASLPGGRAQGRVGAAITAATKPNRKRVASEREEDAPEDEDGEEDEDEEENEDGEENEDEDEDEDEDEEENEDEQEGERSRPTNKVAHRRRQASEEEADAEGAEDAEDAGDAENADDADDADADGAREDEAAMDVEPAADDALFAPVKVKDNILRNIEPVLLEAARRVGWRVVENRTRRSPKLENAEAWKEAYVYLKELHLGRARTSVTFGRVSAFGDTLLPGQPAMASMARTVKGYLDILSLINDDVSEEQDIPAFFLRPRSKEYVPGSGVLYASHVVSRFELRVYSSRERFDDVIKHERGNWFELLLGQRCQEIFANGAGAPRIRRLKRVLRPDAASAARCAVFISSCYEPVGTVVWFGENMKLGDMVRNKMLYPLGRPEGHEKIRYFAEEV